MEKQKYIMKKGRTDLPQIIDSTNEELAEEKGLVYIHTFSGIAFDLLNPKPEMILIDDIAHSLSLINRFNGAALFPYSVAQHSLYVASLLPPELKLHGLLHDAAEAYIGDMVSPLKKIMPQYKIVEEKISKVVALVFGLTYPTVGSKRS
jgi:hypothetical protein